MYTHDVPNQLLLLSVVCSSFFIYLFTIGLFKGKSGVKLTGIAFFMPLVLGIASFLSEKPDISRALLCLSEMTLLLLLLGISLLHPKGRLFNAFLFSFYLIPLFLIALTCTTPAFVKFINMSIVHIPVICLISLAAMMTRRKAAEDENLFFWAMFCFMAKSLMEIFGRNTTLNYLSTALVTSAYVFMMLYTYKKVHHVLLKTVEQAEKQMTAVNRSLELEVKKRVFEIELSNERLLEISKTDALTKALNKAGLLDRMDMMLGSRKTPEFCILMFDIDFFKNINDSLGHLEGDKCLRKLSLIARKTIRDVDFIGRYGGDEFIIVLPGTSVAQASVVAERFRKNVAESTSPHFTVSIGIASYPQDGVTAKDLIAAADEGLYLSKNKGRNAVSCRNSL